MDNEQDKVRQGTSVTLRNLFPIKPGRLTPEDMKQIQEQSISTIERKLNGNTTDSGQDNNN